MRNSKSLSAKPSCNQKKIKAIKAIALILILAAVSFFGFLDAGYLTAKHYLKTPIVCSIFEGCEKVLTSPYAVIYNIPVALLGMIFYLVIFLTSLFYLTFEKKSAVNLIFILSAAAFLASLYFIYLQLFIIKAICFYCLLSAASSAVLFVLSFLLFVKIRINESS
ncbi:MAG: vitamin K epoxide reductase family protein [Patescibacteria group bacterium]